MNPIYLTLATLLVVAQLVLPRRYGFAPLIFAAFHVGNVEFIGDFTIHRMLVLVGLFRAVGGGFVQWPVKNSLDIMFPIFAIIALLTASAHSTAGYNFYVANLGLILNVCGTYIYGRSYFNHDQWPQIFASVVVIAIIPLALLMFAEKINRKNYHSLLGTTESGVQIREGEVRSRGAFGHAILGGTSGAVSFAICAVLWWDKRKKAIIGMVSCFIIVMSSGSSGPIASILVAIAGLWFWRKRIYIKRVIWLALFSIIPLELYMNKPFYYIIARVDFAGGTGWHRCRLIESSIEHFNEWWLAGTDYTRHWMPTGVSWNPNHTDLTNYYLHIGVTGGFFLMLTLIGMILSGFRIILQRQSLFNNEYSKQEFIFWCLGATLLAHTVTFISVSYFDQMYVLFYLLLAGIGGLPNFFPKVTTVSGRDY